MKPGFSKAKAWTLFDSLDVDGDHTISMDEFSERLGA